MSDRSLLDGFAALAAQGGNGGYLRPISRMSSPPPAPGNRPEHCYTVTLFQRRPDDGPPPARKDLIAALPPPPAGMSEADMLAWLCGDIVDIFAPAIAVPCFSDDPDGLADLVARWQADKMFPFGHKDRRAVSEIELNVEESAFLHAQAAHSGTAAEGDRRAAVAAFADAMVAVLEACEPRSARALGYHGAVLRVPRALAETISRARKIEAAWAAEWAGELCPDRQRTGSSATDRENRLLERAVYFHLVMSRPVISALREALLEMRHSLTHRARDTCPAPSPGLPLKPNSRSY